MRFCQLRLMKPNKLLPPARNLHQQRITLVPLRASSSFVVHLIVLRPARDDVRSRARACTKARAQLFLRQFLHSLLRLLPAARRRTERTSKLMDKIIQLDCSLRELICVQVHFSNECAQKKKPFSRQTSGTGSAERETVASEVVRPSCRPQIG